MGDNRPINGSYTTYFILKNEAYSNRPISRVIKLVVYSCFLFTASVWLWPPGPTQVPWSISLPNPPIDCDGEDSVKDNSSTKETVTPNSARKCKKKKPNHHYVGNTVHGDHLVD